MPLRNFEDTKSTAVTKRFLKPTINLKEILVKKKLFAFREVLFKTLRSVVHCLYKLNNSSQCCKGKRNKPVTKVGNDLPMAF